MQDIEILSKPFKELPVSRILKDGSAIMGFNTIQDILDTKPEDLVANEEFNYVWFGELIEFLTEIKMLHLLQPPHGNSRV